MVGFRDIIIDYAMIFFGFIFLANRFIFLVKFDQVVIKYNYIIDLITDERANYR